MSGGSPLTILKKAWLPLLIVAVLVIAGMIGKYYFFSANTSWRLAPVIRKGNAWFGIVVAIAAIVWGFITIGSPAKQRAIRFDSERVNDLSSIQYQIINYWQRNDAALPASLNDLNDSLGTYAVPRDPETNTPYEYLKGQSSTSFRLCATFDEASPANAGRGDYYATSYPMTYPGSTEETWKHDKGMACFDRTIDPTRYQPLPSKSVQK